MVMRLADVDNEEYNKYYDKTRLRLIRSLAV